jgi:multidrug resistance efflux pump
MVMPGCSSSESPVHAGASIAPPAAAAGSAAPPQAAAAQTASLVTRGDFVRDLQLTGELEATRSIAIKSPETSLWQLRITYMAKEGSFVEKGQPILDFDNSSLAAQHRELETQILDARTQIVAKKAELASALKDLEIELAEKQYENDRSKVEASVDADVMSAKEYSERKLAFEKAETSLKETTDRIDLTQKRGKAELDVLEINLDKLEGDLQKASDQLELLSIKAPATGLIVYERRQGTTLRFQEGDSCWPGQNVMQLPDLNEMKVVFSVSEVDAPLLAVGMPMEVSLDAFPGRRLMGKITNIPSMAVRRADDSKLRIFKVTASLEETWVSEMKPGMSVRGRIELDRKTSAPLIARTAVRFDGKDYWLNEPEDSAGAEPRRIEPLDRNALWYLISEEAYAMLAGAGDEPARTALGG